MLKKAAVLTGAAAGLMVLAPVANADSAGSDGLNLLNDSKVSVPVQACGDTIPVVGAVLKVGATGTHSCVGSGLKDH